MSENMQDGVVLTPDGKRKLEDELNELKVVKRAQVVKDIAEARAHGDLSENELIEQLSACCERVCDLLGEAARGRQTSFAASFCRFIDEHLGDSALSVRLVADHFAISEPTLQKAIRMEKGCSFFDYVEQQRYERALSLLRSTSLPIAEVAKVCGFNSTNAFYKAFKRKSSITPAVVRMQAREASLLAGE